MYSTSLLLFSFRWSSIPIVKRMGTHLYVWFIMQQVVIFL